MKKRFTIWLILTILWMIMIFLFSAQPGAQSSAMSGRLVTVLNWVLMKQEWLVRYAETIIRKGAHMGEYAVLAILFCNLLRETTYRDQTKWFAFLFTVLYAACDEFHQLFVPGRSGMWQDIGIDAIGAICGLLLWWFFDKRRRKHHKQSAEYEITK